MKILIVAISFSVIGVIFSSTVCEIASTKDLNIKNFEDCKRYSTASESNVCCYVKGTDTKENPISACNELTGTVKGALKDLKKLEGQTKYSRNYYLTADCNLGQTISICDPDDQKSESPLSVEECSKYPVVNNDVNQIEEDAKSFSEKVKQGFEDFKTNLENNETFRTVTICVSSVIGIALIYVIFLIIRKIWHVIKS